MTWLSVDLPDPFGPMIACTSPLFTASDSPCRISRSSTRTCRFLTSSNAVILFPLFSPGTGFSAPCPIRFPRADDQKEHRRHSNDLHRRRENRRIGAFPPYHYESANQNHKEKDDNKRVALRCRRYRAVSSQFWPEPKLVHCYPTLPSKLIEIS